MFQAGALGISQQAGFTPRRADARLARQAGPAVDYEGPGTSYAALPAGCGGS